MQRFVGTLFTASIVALASGVLWYASMALEYKDPCAGPKGVIDISLFGLLPSWRSA
jgi:hypothetical protein